ncbi:tRNA uracil 4-sulfurtransferase ThiI [Ileibacterium valens]|uniref:Probable tRNA sulfurtransferase n=1 Tax=Ileibacterium valens TaxID=1862668 RepID=A0A1U7NFC9_9FIRM|nr:tRNA uracil 4-sulfurtransferase ThiI [Ileibacterium valens]OLU38794.1 tRNA 4-thiouridine(8) synthase ThiI [Ileibacterium valens]OLU38864.1 tRNA 4-thiouridine(8) synthase ThiI [Erysipelotrichaceae bacterium NYU-BL-E8]OLU43343.1 tRNA 4-thiouridine(8) synthase ThiI [Erysipelotrichaceae bacterium NYU-BL-F16]
MDYSYEYLLVRYGELSLKGKNKKNFINRLRENTKKALAGFKKCKVEAGYDRMYIYLNGENPDTVSEVISKVFGISSFSLAMKVPADMDAILEATKQACDLSVPKTFKVRARRHDKMFPVISDQINRQVATAILKNSDWKVDVHHPQVEIIIEVREDAAYIMTDKIAGAGGYPVGIGGRAMVLLSGGIDSPVAGYQVMKRGIHIEAIHFAAPPYTSSNALDKVKKLGSEISAYQGDLVLHVVPFTTLQLAIYHYCPESYAITIMRRMMMRIATELARRRHCLAVATGESVGQVASQTLESMSVISQIACMPILRPLVCMDKIEIIDLSRKIGTYETSILPFEDCCTIFTPKAPATKPHLDKCEEYEAKWDWQTMVEDCVNQAEMIRLSPNMDEVEDEEADLF